MKQIIIVVVFIVSTVSYAVDSSPINDHQIFYMECLQQTAVTIPVGTSIFVKTTQEIRTNTLNSGDAFFVELTKDISQKGKVLIPKGTLVQMQVVYSKSDEHNKNVFNVTIGGFIIDNYLQRIRTENKIIAVDGPTGEGPSKVKLTSSSSKSEAFLEDGTSIIFPSGTEATFKLASALRVTW